MEKWYYLLKYGNKFLKKYRIRRHGYVPVFTPVLHEALKYQTIKPAQNIIVKLGLPLEIVKYSFNEKKK